MDLIKELKSMFPDGERLLELITDENVSYIDNDGYTPLMYAFKYYGDAPDCDSSIFSKMLDMNCRPEQVAKYGTTALMNAFMYYGTTPDCNSSILSKMLDMNCLSSQADCDGHTALMCAFQYYGENPNCNHNILLKLLNMNCNPE